jgi:hypothetical protein
MEGLDMMDWMLEEAKKTPMEIHHDFDTRFRVWVDQIIPSRIDAIRQCGGDLDYAVRMVRLTSVDARRMKERALHEYTTNEQLDPERLRILRIEYVLEVVMVAINVYLNEVKE